MARRRRHMLPGSCALSMWLSAADLLAAPSAEDAARKAIQDLEAAASFEENRIRDKCKEASPASVDLEAEAGALRAANIHLSRIEQAKAWNTAAHDLVPLAHQAADDLRHAYDCNRNMAKHLEEARRVLESIRSMLPEEGTTQRESIDKALAEIAALYDGHPKPEPAAPSKIEVRFVQLDQGEVRFKTPLRASYLGHLSLRLETGFGVADLERLGDREREHRGPYLRGYMLARFLASEQRRIRLLFGFYYGALFARQSPEGSDLKGNVVTHDVGAHFEMQWIPAAKVDPWLSLHPFMDLGMEYVRIYSTVPDFAGFQGGGGLMVCIWHASICPGLRVVTVPRNEEKRRPTVQVGLSIDLMRLIDMGLARRRPKDGRQAAQPRQAKQTNFDWPAGSSKPTPRAPIAGTRVAPGAVHAIHLQHF